MGGAKTPSSDVEEISAVFWEPFGKPDRHCGLEPIVMGQAGRKEGNTWRLADVGSCIACFAAQAHSSASHLATQSSGREGGSFGACGGQLLAGEWLARVRG